MHSKDSGAQKLTSWKASLGERICIPYPAEIVRKGKFQATRGDLKGGWNEREKKLRKIERKRERG